MVKQGQAISLTSVVSKVDLGLASESLLKSLFI